MIARGGGGSLVAVSSTSAIHGAPTTRPTARRRRRCSAWCGPWRSGLAPHAIRVNSLLPGWTRTDMTAAGSHGSFRDATMRRTPVRRWAVPDEMGPSAVFLADPTPPSTPATPGRRRRLHRVLSVRRRDRSAVREHNDRAPERAGRRGWTPSRGATRRTRHVPSSRPRPGRPSPPARRAPFGGRCRSLLESAVSAGRRRRCRRRSRRGSPGWPFRTLPGPGPGHDVPSQRACGGVHALTAATAARRTRPASTAHSTARRDASDPSTPTTIRSKAGCGSGRRLTTTTGIGLCSRHCWLRRSPARTPRSDSALSPPRRGDRHPSTARADRAPEGR